MPVSGATQKPPSMPLDNSASVEKLAAFIKDNVKGDAKLVGKMEGGQIVLHVRKHSTFMERLSGDNVKQKALASKGIAQVFERAFAEKTSGLQGLSRSDAKQVEKLTSDVLAFAGASGGHALKGEQVEAMITAYEGLVANLPKGESGPKLADLGDMTQVISDAGTQIKAAMKTDGDLSKVEAKFGEAIVSKFLEGNPSDQKKNEFFTSTGARLRQELCESLHENFVLDEMSTELLEEMVMRSVNNAAAAIFPHRHAVVGSDSEIQWKTDDGANLSMKVPHIEIDNVLYKPVSHAGSGGFAEVFIYQSTGPQSKTIAVKIATTAPKADKDLAFEDFRKEIEAHQKAEGTGHQNLLHMEGAIRFPDGRTAIALEAAPLGHALKLGEDINAALAKNLITPQQARTLQVTAIKDLLQGLQHMQETQDVLHRDIKAYNVLVGNDGRLKIMDFGTAIQGTTYAVDHRIVDNPTWQAPEVLDKLSKFQKVRGGANVFKAKQQGHDRSPISAFMKRLFPHSNEDARQMISGNMLNAARNANVAQFVPTNTVGGKSDVWAIGMTAADIIRGDRFGRDVSFLSQLEKKLVDFSKNPTSKAFQPLNDGNLPDNALMESTGDTGLDAFLNRLLAPRPDDRPLASEALHDPIFNQRGVDSDAAHALVVALKSGDQNEIALKRAALEREINPPPPNRPLPQTPDQTPISPNANRPLPTPPDTGGA